MSAPQPVTTTAVPERPLSPHLTIYRKQITSVMSIFHRFTGMALCLGFVALVVWLACLAWNREAYEVFMRAATSPVGKVFLFGWTWAFFYHFCCGIRHLLWDAGFFLTNRGVISTGRVALGVSTLLTLGLWAKVLGYGVCPWM